MAAIRASKSRGNGRPLTNKANSTAEPLIRQLALHITGHNFEGKGKPFADSP
jgi:hypothetical protein